MPEPAPTSLQALSAFLADLVGRAAPNMWRPRRAGERVELMTLTVGERTTG